MATETLQGAEIPGLSLLPISNLLPVLPTGHTQMCLLILWVKVESRVEGGDGRTLQMTYDEHLGSSHTGRDNKGKLPIAGEKEFPG